MSNSPVTETGYSAEYLQDGVYSITTTTCYNAAGQPLSSVQKQLISELSPTLESKSVLVSERGLTSTQWTVYSGGTKRVQYSTVPGSSITAETVTVDDVVFSQKDTAGITTTATRPLAIQLNGTWYTYGWDLTKNICELYGQHGYIRTAYTYTPYGQVTAEGDVTQSIQWSSQFNDTELGLIYYNYRHYNPVDGRWTGRDLYLNASLYQFCCNIPTSYFDNKGNMGFSAAVIILGIAVVGIMAVSAELRRQNGVALIFAPGLFGYDENESSDEESWRVFKDKYTGTLFYDHTIRNREDLQYVADLCTRTSTEKCIKKLILAAHGKKEKPDKEADFDVTMILGWEELSESSTISNISDMFEGIRFCTPCHIELRVCHIGSSKRLQAAMKAKYPCKITMYEGKVKP